MTGSSDSDEQAAPTQASHPKRGVLALALRAAMPIGLLAIGWFSFKKLSEKTDHATSETPEAQVVRTQVTELRVEDYTVSIVSQGLARPHHEVTLTPQVPGNIVRIHPKFEDGAFFSAGDVLVELDAADYETAVVAAEAQVARNKAALAQEEARSKQAKLNWEDLGYKEKPSELVLRLPQLQEAKASFKSAEVLLEQARRDLGRTMIRAPFDGRVRQRTVGLGQSVGAGTSLGVVFSVDYAEVRLPISGRQLRNLSLPEIAGDAPVDVQLRDAIADEEGGVAETVWNAKIIRTEGTLDRDSLELFAIAQVHDPFGLKSGNPPLRIGQPVEASISGKVLKNVVALPRAAVWQLDQVHLVEGESLTLKIVTIVPIWKDEERVIVRDIEIPDGALLATTRLVHAPDGAKVEIIPDMGSSLVGEPLIDAMKR
jgi:RND family efflux transporter MFP subunit